MANRTRRRGKRPTRRPAPGAARRVRLGKLLARARSARGLSLRDVADVVGLTPAAICDYEAGRREPPGLTLIDVAKVLRVDAGDLGRLARAA